jgi:hypothetical protein
MTVYRLRARVLRKRTDSDHLVKFLDAFGNARDAAEERIFIAAYDSPLLQALVGLRADGAETGRQSNIR